MPMQVHECASVLKQFLANLPQPILTEAYFRAHCQVHFGILTRSDKIFLAKYNFAQVPLLVKESMTEEEKDVAVEKQVGIGFGPAPLLLVLLYLFL